MQSPGEIKRREVSWTLTKKLDFHLRDRPRKRDGLLGTTPFPLSMSLISHLASVDVNPSLISLMASVDVKHHGLLTWTSSIMFILTDLPLVC